MSLLEKAAGKEGWSLDQAMRYFLICAANALRKPTCLGFEAEDCETRYMEVVKSCHHADVTMNRMAELFSLVVEALSEDIYDFLSPIFMETVSNARMGQFFTPDGLCQATAQMLLGDVEQLLAVKEVISIQEPAGGTGGMLLACCKIMRAQGINYQERVFFDYTDLDIKAWHGAYLQLALVGAAARLTYGNTLSLEIRDRAYTPMLILRPWVMTKSQKQGKQQKSLPVAA